MTTPANLRALARVVESADAKNPAALWDIDGDIADVVGAPKHRVPDSYTSSLDAAVTLALQHGFIATLGCIAADGLPGCCLCTSTDPVTEVWGVSLASGDAVGRLARATVAAALRARAAEMEAGREPSSDA